MFPGITDPIQSDQILSRRHSPVSCPRRRSRRAAPQAQGGARRRPAGVRGQRSRRSGARPGRMSV